LKRFALIWVATICCLAGCSRSATSRSGKPGKAPPVGTGAGMVAYLLDQDLPDLESVELWDNKYGLGLRLTTPHYVIFTTFFEPLLLRRVPQFMESAYRGYNAQLPEPIESANRFIVYLFSSRSQWVDFTRRFTGPRAKLFCKLKAGPAELA